MAKRSGFDWRTVPTSFMERKGIVVVIRNSFVPLWSFLVLRMCESVQIMWWGQHICLALVLNVCQDFIPYLNFSSFAFNGAGKSLKWGKSLISLELTPHLVENSFEILSLFSTTFLYVNSYKMQKKRKKVFYWLSCANIHCCCLPFLKVCPLSFWWGNGD